MSTPTTDVGAVAEAVTATAGLVKDIVDQPHPLIEAWKMFRLRHRLVRFCKKYPNEKPENVVGATCYLLPLVTQSYLVQIVKDSL